jgi:hypothetical protein
LPRYPYPGNSLDGGSCVNSGGGYYDCSCTDRPYAVAFSATLDGNTTWSNVDLTLVRQDRVTVPVAVTPPAKGAPGANAYLLASLLAADGSSQTTFVFQDPRRQRGDSGVLDRASVSLALGLKASVTQLRIENWGTGQVLLALDLRGHLQLLCIDRPCLSVCQSSDGGVGGVDGALTVDGAAVDGAAMDGAAVDGGRLDAPRAIDAPVASDAGVDGAVVDVGAIDRPASDTVRVDL